MLLLAWQILLSMFSLAFSTPLYNAGGGISMPLRRQSLRRQPPVHHGSERIFSPMPAKRELHHVLQKYAGADQLLTGIGLGPDRGPMGLLPNADILSDNAVNIDSLISTAEAPFLPSVLPGTGVMPMEDLISDSVDILYYGPLSIGTPRQTMTVDVDTGSADLWVPVDCASCTNNQFDAEQSSTYKAMGDEFSISYGAGDAYGTLASDVVSVGGMRVEGQVFGAVTRASDDFSGFPNDGMLGLAFGTIARSKRPTFFERLIANETLAAPLFSVHLTRNHATGSEVCFGCYDPTKTTGAISWVPVKSKTYWSVTMDELVLNSTMSISTSLVAAIDTGTTLIYVPEEIATSFYNLIPGARPAVQYGSEFFTYPCSAHPKIAFSFSGQRFSIDPVDFNLGKTSPDSQDCVGGILSLGREFPSNLAIIGDEFLKSWYSTYDYSNGARVGFSPSINNNKVN